MSICKAVGCENETLHGNDFCHECEVEMAITQQPSKTPEPESMEDKYPAYYKKVGNMTSIDVYAVHHLFNIQDPSGAIQHASKKLLLSGVRTGGKSVFKDIKESRDTLTRWLQLNEDTQ